MDRLAETVVVFDLDDTLYPEEDYVRSGIAHVCALVRTAYGVDALEDAEATRRRGGDWLDAICSALPRAEDLKSSLLWAYRTHSPAIRLTPEMAQLVKDVRARARGVAILTDGRAVAQRLKLAALGLDAWSVFISDEHDGAFKPDPTRFVAVASRFPAARHIYVADNPVKDFQAPLAMGWRTVGFDGFVARRAGETMPHVWAGSADALLSALEDGDGSATEAAR